MRIPKNISLDETTHSIASDIDDFSAWVRAALLTWDELGRIDTTTVLRVSAYRTWRQAVREMHRRTWARANALHRVEFTALGATITDDELAALADALEGLL